MAKPKERWRSYLDQQGRAKVLALEERQRELKAEMLAPTIELIHVKLELAKIKSEACQRQKEAEKRASVANRVAMP